MKQRKIKVSVIPGQTIRKLCVNEPFMIEPFAERSKFMGLSYGLSFAGYDIRIAQDVTVQQGRTFVVASWERFKMPYDILGEVKDKSTLARVGLKVQNTVIEPGWRGTLAIELTFEPIGYGESRIEIKAGMPIAQVVFYRLEELPETAYYGKYQDQMAYDIKAKFE